MQKLDASVACRRFNFLVIFAQIEAAAMQDAKSPGMQNNVEAFLWLKLLIFG